MHVRAALCYFQAGSSVAAPCCTKYEVWLSTLPQLHVLFVKIWHFDFEPKLKHLPGVFRVPEY